MKTYREQDGCHNCVECFRFEEYDEQCDYYCSEGRGERPPCGSSYMDETFGVPPLSTYVAERQKWFAWSNGGEVNPWGICDKHRRQQ